MELQVKIVPSGLYGGSPSKTESNRLDMLEYIKRLSKKIGMEHISFGTVVYDEASRSFLFCLDVKESTRAINEVYSQVVKQIRADGRYDYANESFDLSQKISEVFVVEKK